MLHPVGNLPARVYWRRRLVFVGLPLLGIILLLWAALSGGGDHPSARTTASTTTSPASAPATSTQPRDSGSIGVSTTTPKPIAPATTPATTASSTSPAVQKGFCKLADLTVVAGTAKKSFAVKSKPVLDMLVTNTTAAPCKLDVADKHVEWRVYSGDARVWGSHDCSVQSGANVITLTARQTIRLSITWSGLTSLPKCAGTRLAVQAGTYKLSAYLDNKASAATTFTITSVQ
jgi:hypothetical protein